VDRETACGTVNGQQALFPPSSPRHLNGLVSRLLKNCKLDANYFIIVTIQLYYSLLFRIVTLDN